MRQAFRMFVERKTLPPMRGVNSHQYMSKDTSHTSIVSSGGYMNAMQFSHTWRKLTGESGNLYREIQVGLYGCVCLCRSIVITTCMPIIRI